MQLAGDAALAAAVASDYRTIVYRFEVDWNRDGLYSHALSDLTDTVTELVTQRDTNSSLPPEATLIDGYLAARMDVRLGVRRPTDEATITELLSMWRTDSSLFGVGRTGVSVRASIGHRLPDGTETLPRQFTGQISEFRVDSSSRTVSIVCLDPAAKVKKSIDLPGFALAPNSVKSAGLNLFLKQNNQWVIDYVLRQNGYYMTPPMASDQYTFYSATLHGSPVPERGFQPWFWIGEGSLPEDSQPYGPGRPGWGLAWGGRNWYGVIQARARATDFRPISGRRLTIQCQVDTTQAGGSTFSSSNWLVEYSSGNGYLVGTSVRVGVDVLRRIVLEISTEGSVVGAWLLGTLPTGWADCWVNIFFNGANSEVRSSVLGGTGLIDLSGLPSNPATSTYPHVYTFAQLPMHDLQITNQTAISLAQSRYDVGTWVPQADIDTSLNDITGIPLRRGANSWELLKEIVGAEYGLVGFTESGRPFFKNRDTVRRGTLTTVKEATDAKEITGLSMAEREDAIRNAVTYTYARRLITGPADNPKSWSVIYSLKEATELLLAPGVSTIQLVLDEPNARVDAYVTPTQFTTAQWIAEANAEVTKHGFVTTTPDGVAVTSGITCTSVLPMNPASLGPDKIRLTFNNTTNSYVQFKTTDGQPALRIRGNAHFSSPDVSVTVRRDGSVAKYGERTFEIPRSDWHQLDSSLRRIADSLLRDLASPVPIVDQFSIVGDCRLQLQDALSVADTAGLGGPVFCSVTGIARRLTVDSTGAKLTDQLQVRPSAAPGKWILGHPTWGILGQTTKL